MSGRIRNHLRSNVVGYIALFFVLTGGTAYALDGSNTVFSDDIVNGEVKAADLGTDSVTSSRILDGQVHQADLGTDSVSSGKILDGQVHTADLGPASVVNGKIAPDAVIVPKRRCPGRKRRGLYPARPPDPSDGSPP